MVADFKWFLTGETNKQRTHCSTNSLQDGRNTQPGWVQEGQRLAHPQSWTSSLRAHHGKLLKLENSSSMPAGLRSSELSVITSPIYAARLFRDSKLWGLLMHNLCCWRSRALSQPGNNFTMCVCNVGTVTWELVTAPTILWGCRVAAFYYS